jgi:hypothetical protein
MIGNPTALTADLKKQLAALESDLRLQIGESHADGALRSKWRAALTDATYESWRDEQITYGAAAWLLSTLILRFCEDNDLIETPYLAGPGDRLRLASEQQTRFLRANPGATVRDWIREGIDELRTGQAATGLPDPDGETMRLFEISPVAADRLIDFWRTQENDRIVHDFTDPERNTGFLAAVYQELSGRQRSRYALLETPHFVVDFLLDRTLQPAIEEFGLDNLRLIDPVCGSGTFLLAAFHRLLEHWKLQEADATPWELVRNVLRSVHGVDKNPIAVTVARFRILVAAIEACSTNRLADVPRLRIVIAEGDSLLRGREAPGYSDMFIGVAHEQLSGLGSDVDQFSRVDLLGANSYHVVVGNPPYITPKDKAEAATYRSTYPYITGSYALTVPFIMRFFGLGVRGAGRAGYVGLLVSNSFMKREFGRRLVENFFPSVDLTDVIDTSGVFIPGHGTPTTILLGRSRPPRDMGVKVITDIRGEPQVPADPAQGVVWRSILKGADHAWYEDDWVQVLDIDRKLLGVFPWNLSDASTTKILGLMERGIRLGERVARIGYFASTGSDEIFTAAPASFRRASAEPRPRIPVITGSEVRDWQVHAELDGAMFAEAGDRALDIADFPYHLRRLWPYRTALELRRNYSGQSYLDDGRRWYGWHHITETPRTHPWSLIFPWVSTHNHFAVLRERAAPLNSAPIIRLPDTASDSDVVQLAALLNSSLACFWLKHHSNSKGQPRTDQTGTGEPWTLFYEFTGTRLGDFPLPPDRWSGDRWSVYAEQTDRLAQELTANAPRTLLGPDSVVTPAELDEACARWESAHTRLVALQEELDWEIYERYGLLDGADQLVASSNDTLPGLRPGERAFEIDLARRVARGETSTTWFSRHGIEPVTDPPQRWPSRYRKIVENRIRAIEQRPYIGLVERPEFKRRWASQSWEVQEKQAIRRWLLDRCERPYLWYERRNGALHPRPLTVRELTDRLRSEENFVALAERFAGRPVDLESVIAEIIRDEHVPHLASLRYTESGLQKYAHWLEVWNLQRETDEAGQRPDIPMPPRYMSADFLKPAYWRLRGKHDVPNERFISYSHLVPDDELILGWAGWNHAERARVLIDVIESHKRDDRGGDVLIPLLAGIKELLFWIRQWYGTDEASEYLEREQSAHGLSDSDLLSWRPPKSKRGRPRKQPVS